MAFAATGSPSMPGSPSQTSTNPNSTPAPNSPAKPKHPRVIGKVVNVSSTGGLSNQGTITVAEPNGHQTTFSLTSSTKAWKYQGEGVKPVKESPTSIATNEVIEAGLQNQTGGVAAHRIVDTGFKAG